MTANYKCDSCDKEIEYKKEYKIDFPDQIHLHCLEYDVLATTKDCLCILKRDFGKCSARYEVAEGSVGNAKNGYSKTLGSYIPASSTPLKPRHDSMF